VVKRVAGFALIDNFAPFRAEFGLIFAEQFAMLLFHPSLLCLDFDVRILSD